MPDLIAENITSLRSPETLAELAFGLKSKLTKDSVMEPGFLSSLLATEGSPVDFDNLSSLIGGRARQSVVDPIRGAFRAIDKGFSGQALSLADLAAITEFNSSVGLGSGFLSGLRRGVSPNRLSSVPVSVSKGKGGAPKKRLIGGARLKELGSPRPTSDLDFLIFDKDKPIFSHGDGKDFVNAAKHGFLGDIHKKETGNEKISLNSLLELKIFSFIQHSRNFNFKKAAIDEFDIKFLADRLGGDINLGIVKKHVAPGELSEAINVIN